MPDSILTYDRRGLMFVLSSPSGAGKTTLSRRMLELDHDLRLSISSTTRPMRPGEVDGEDYFFISKDMFADLIMNDEFLEHAKVFDHYYGTPKLYVEKTLQKGQDVLFDIDWQGTRQLKNNARRDLVSVFILPPSMEELGRRLRSRAQDTEEVIQGRMEKSLDEISHWDEYDYVLVNEDLDATLEKIMAILIAERHRRKRQTFLDDFVCRLHDEQSG